MSIQNTEKLTQPRADLGNAGLRGFGYIITEPEISDPLHGLAAYFGLGALTVRRWFAGVGKERRIPYRRCVPRFVWEETPPNDTTGPGYRVSDMMDAQGKSGAGDAVPEALGGSNMSNLRQRCFLAFCLGVYGGLERVPIYTGDPKEIREPKGTLKECLYRINQIYTGQFTYFMYHAWWRFEIEPDIEHGEGWVLVITYNARDYHDQSDGEEVPYEEE